MDRKFALKQTSFSSIHSNGEMVFTIVQGGATASIFLTYLNDVRIPAIRPDTVVDIIDTIRKQPCVKLKGGALNLLSCFFCKTAL